MHAGKTLGEIPSYYVRLNALYCTYCSSKTVNKLIFGKSTKIDKKNTFLARHRNRKTVDRVSFVYIFRKKNIKIKFWKYSVWWSISNHHLHHLCVWQNGMTWQFSCKKMIHSPTDIFKFFFNFQYLHVLHFVKNSNIEIWIFQIFFRKLFAYAMKLPVDK